jgi:hypothetical protein
MSKTKKEATASPTPWGIDDWDIVDANGDPVANLCLPSRHLGGIGRERLNRETIVRAVNSHPDLLTALRSARSSLVVALECGLDFPKAERAEIIANHVDIKAIDAAIAKATGGKS